MAVLLKTVSVQVSSIQIMQVRVQNKGKSVWKSRYNGDVSVTTRALLQAKTTFVRIACTSCPLSNWPPLSAPFPLNIWEEDHGLYK